MIGFMQGRLVEPVDNKIQAFPKDKWVEELNIASQNEFNKIELTVDLEGIWENPLTNKLGLKELKNNLDIYKIEPVACTGDFIMHEPPWRSSGTRKKDLIETLKAVIDGLGFLNIPIFVFPLVDQSSLNKHEESTLASFIKDLEEDLIRNNVRIAFESDYPPEELKRFIMNYNPKVYGINYDIGNSASLGFSPEEEINCYFEHIIHVHVKDRFLNGATTRLGNGNANIEMCVNILTSLNYSGNYVLQTARSEEGNHLKELIYNRDYFLSFFKQ
tara:strand:- start:1535 stop:2353 length:819 start_codon:yes stop_codon:yes gene_type:complete